MAAATIESADEVEALLSMATEVVPGSSGLQLAGLSNLEGNIITEVSMSELKPIVMTMANMANVPFDNNFDGVPEPASVVQISDRSETVLASHLLGVTPPASATKRPPRVQQTSSEIYRDSSTGVTYEIQRGGTRRGGDKLIDSLGFTYNLKAGKGNKNITYWWCAVRNNQLRCPASVTQKGNVFMRGKRKHEHLVGQSTPKPSHDKPVKVVKVKAGRPLGSIKQKPSSSMSKGSRDFKIIKHGSKAGMDLLKDFLGYTYTLKKVIGGGKKTYWCCSVRNKHLRCPASVIQYEDSQFTEGAFEHKHLPSFNIPAAPHENIPSLKRLREQHELDESESDFEDDETDHSYGVPKHSGSVYLHSGKASNSRIRVPVSRERKRRDHQTFLGPRCTINLTKCDDPDCNCRMVHCPFCNKHHFKPTKAGRVQDHLELTHFAHGVQYDDLMIVKCFHDCDLDKNYGHFHCVFCFRTMLKRTAYARHMLRHMMKMGIPDRLLVLPDSKFPDIINAYGYEIPICKTKSCGPPNGEKHYHCPSCNHMCRERSLTVNHLWRCLQKKRDGISETSDDPDEDIVGVIDEDQLIPHITLVKSFKDIPVDKCMSIDCCHQNYHCKLCPENVFMPTYRQHLIAHYVTHWKQRVLYKNFSILKCFHPCDGVDRTMCKTRYHFHCPICEKIILTKGTFEDHLKTCHMFRFGENLIQNSKPEFDTAFEDDINLRQESAPLNENVEFMEDQLTSQAIKHAERVRLSRGRTWKTKKSGDGGKQAKKGSKKVGEKDVYKLCSAIISPTLARKVKSVSHLKSILGGVAGATRVKLTVSAKGQYRLSGPAEELLEAQKMLAKKINKEMKVGKRAMKVKLTTATQKKSPEREVKKGRGRPRKSTRDGESFPYSEIRQIIEASKAKSGDTTKRGRGRPPKKTPVKDEDEPKSISLSSPSVTKLKEGSSKNVKSGPSTPETPRTPGRYGTRGVRKDYLEMSSGGFRREIKQEPMSDYEEVPVARVNSSQKAKTGSGRKRGRPPKQAGRNGGNARKKQEDWEEENDGNVEDDDANNDDDDDNEGQVVNELDGSDLGADETDEGEQIEDEGEQVEDEGGDLEDEGEQIEDDGDDSLIEEEEEEDMDDSLSLFDDSEDDYLDDEDDDENIDEKMDGTHSKYTETGEDMLPGRIFPSPSEDGEVSIRPGNISVEVGNSQVRQSGNTGNSQSISMQAPPVLKLGMKKSNLPKTKLIKAEDGVKVEKDWSTTSTCFEDVKADDNMCSLCEDYKAETFADLTEHLKVIHHVYEPPRCDVCEVDFDTLQTLNLHIDKRHGPHPEKIKYICDNQECGKEFVSENGLAGHVNRVHLGLSKVAKGKRYSCEKCDYKCNSVEDIYEHKKVEHDEQMRCEECNKVFVSYSSFKSHNQLTHSTTSASCKVCEKTFSNESYLNKHMKTHSASQDFTCNICKKTLKSKATLRDHLETHKDPSDRTYRYICSYCGKQFALKSNLSDHLNKHTGARPYKCDICLKAFGFRSMLMKHKTFVHSSERPFKCGVCHKGFKFLNLLQNHITTHTNTSKHVCPHCAKTFSTKSTLKFHSQKCSGISWNRNLVVTLPDNRDTLIVYTEAAPSEDTTTLEPDGGCDQEPVIEYDVADDGDQSLVYASLAESANGTNTQEAETVIEDASNMTETIVAGETNMTETVEEDAQSTLETDMGMEQVSAEPAQNTIEVYACSECKATFNTYNEAETHVMTAHSAIPTQAEETMEFEIGGM